MNYKIKKNLPLTHNSFRLTLSPAHSENVFNFKAGQYVFLTQPEFPNDPRPFSISSPPGQKKSLEFSIKIYGHWTQELSEKRAGIIYTSNPTGNFVLKDKVKKAIFLLAGVGISPVMSILRTQVSKKKNIPITVLYGNLTESDIMYRQELGNLRNKLKNFNVTHILSNVEKNSAWKGYRGFITEKIIQKEAKSKNADYFVIGKPVFMQKMLEILEEMNVEKKKIHTEKIDDITIP